MIKAVRTDDFTGGLNLDANAFRLNPNQTNDALNVDFNPKGGVSTRWGFSRLNTNALGAASAGGFDIKRLFPWNNSSRRIMISANNKVWAWPSVTLGEASADDLSISTDSPYGATYSTWDRDTDNSLYIACGHASASRRIEGVTVTSLTTSGNTAWQDDLTNPNGTHCPRGKLIATHAERLWVADTFENSVAHPNRIRFSHPLFPESWREDDFIDVVAGGPNITSIVPFGGHLVVFKQHAVFALYGFNEETFQLVDISRSVGAISPNSVVSSERGIYFFSIPAGMMYYDGTQIKDVFENIRPILVDSEITESAVDSITVGYANRRVYLSLPSGDDVVDILTYDSSVEAYEEAERKYSGSTRALAATKTFVYDESVGKGAWTIYQTSDGFGITGAIDFLKQNGDTIHVAAHPYQPYLLGIDVRTNYSYDNILGTGAAFESYFVTNWQDAKNVSAKKFWRRPEFIMRRDTEGSTVTIDVYHDWDSFDPIKSFNLVAPAADPDVSSWTSWAEPEFGATHFFTDSLGLARAVKLKIYNNSVNPWAVYSIIYKYNPRKLKV